MKEKSNDILYFILESNTIKQNLYEYEIYGPIVCVSWWSGVLILATTAMSVIVTHNSYNSSLVSMVISNCSNNWQV